VCPPAAADQARESGSLGERHELPMGDCVELQPQTNLAPLPLWNALPDFLKKIHFLCILLDARLNISASLY